MGYTRQESGYNANRHEYSTWGNNTKAPSYNYDPEYRATEPYYTGHPYDGSLNLYFAENRFYDPETGSWLSPDPVKDGLNWYQYCGSNPVSRVDPLGLVPYAAAQQNRPELPQEHYAPGGGGENLREGGFYDRLGCEEKKVIRQYQQAFTSYNTGAAYEFFYFGSISSMLNPVMADRVGVLMAKLFSGGYEINGREFNRGREDTSDLLTCIGLVMLLNGAVGAVKGSALGGNLQYAIAGGGTMDAAMAITAENAIVIAALNFMYLDKSNDGIIRRSEGDSDSKEVNVPKNVERQAKKLSPEAKKGYDKVIDVLKSGDTRGLNDHPLSGNRSGQRAIDIKGTGKGRGAGRIIYEYGENGEINIIEILTDHNY